jgi:hypothetical protein
METIKIPMHTVKVSAPSTATSGSGSVAAAAAAGRKNITATTSLRAKIQMLLHWCREHKTLLLSLVLFLLLIALFINSVFIMYMVFRSDGCVHKPIENMRLIPVAFNSSGSNYNRNKH